MKYMEANIAGKKNFHKILGTVLVLLRAWSAYAGVYDNPKLSLKEKGKTFQPKV